MTLGRNFTQPAAKLTVASDRACCPLSTTRPTAPVAMDAAADACSTMQKDWTTPNNPLSVPQVGTEMESKRTTNEINSTRLAVAVTGREREIFIAREIPMPNTIMRYKDLAAGIRSLSKSNALEAYADEFDA